MKILLTEHAYVEISRCIDEDPTDPLLINENLFTEIKEENIRLFKRERGVNVYPFLLEQKNENIFQLKADYYVGIDWLIKDKKFIQVEPKINTKITATFEAISNAPESDEQQTEPKQWAPNKLPDVEYVEVDYLKMLLDIMSAGLPKQYTDNLVSIDWYSSQIPITQKEDHLTPFIVVQFLQLLKIIVQKGLKKTYYKVRKNVTNKVKGKILVGAHIKKNVFKNYLTQTYCEYQAFGQNNIENRFLKKVLTFAESYIENNILCFAGNMNAVKNLINYCRPAFEHIDNDIDGDHIKQVRYNPFFKEYKEAINTGRHILKRFAYNITQTSSECKTTPPFWIDMPRLFELYFYMHILNANSADKNHIHYQFSTHGNSLDLLISKPGYQMVIDIKYKLHYLHGQVHQDIRQVAGYARLKKVRRQLDLEDDQNIDCLIIYPDIKASASFDYSLSQLQNKMRLNPVAAYYKVYKLGFSLPTI